MSLSEQKRRHADAGTRSQQNRGDWGQAQAALELSFVDNNSIVLFMVDV